MPELVGPFYRIAGQKWRPAAALSKASTNERAP
jgi:hypothetical protein